MSFRFTKLLQAIRAANSVAVPAVPSFYLVGSSPQFVTITNQGSGNITRVRNAHITQNVSVSRVTGVAPLYVNIDLTGTTSDLTANATHDLFHSVDWGDPSAGQWANGVQSAGLTDKNWSFGPVGGKVFETPGTYLVTPTSTDGVNTVSKPGYITVLDPNVVYNPAYGVGYETICISNSNNFTGAPGTGALPGVATYINRPGDTDMYAAWIAHKASNKRILFCKADSWTCSAALAITNYTGLFLGGYGAGAAATFGAGTMVSVTPSVLNNSVFNITSGVTDLRICNFKIAADSTTKAVGINNSISQALIYKVEIRGCSAGFTAYPGGGGTNNVMDQHCMYECLVDNVYGYSGVDTPRSNVTTTNGVADIAATAHPYVVGYQVHFPTSGEGTTQFPSTGSFPTPFSASTGYFISSAGFAANSFRLAPTLADALAGTNTITPTASGTYPLFCNGISGGIGAFVGFVKGGMMGCYFDGCNHGEQTVRLPYLDRAHINNNYIARPNQGKNILKIHSFVYSEVALYSEKFIVSGNVFSLRNGYSMSAYTPDPGSVVTATEVGDGAIIIANGGVSGNERVRNGIVESNITYSCLGAPKEQVFAKIGCPNVTLRNNIADFAFNDRSASYTGPYGFTSLNFIQVNSSTDDATVNVNVYNNTLYSNLYNPEVANFVRFTGTATTVTIKNNLWYLPHVNPALPSNRKTATYENTGGFAVNVQVGNNTDTSNLATTNPLFTVTPPEALADWKPATGSYAIAPTGTPVVLRDFNMATRVGGFNHLGAVLP